MPATPNLRQYLLIRDAASFLGVSEATLRNWDREGKIAAYRNRVNGYRLFMKRDLEEVKVLKKSLMPENFGELLTVKELHDLFAYLVTLE